MTLTAPQDLTEAFREAFRCHPAGVAVLTADPGDGPVALTVSSLISVSADPPTVAFSLSSKSSATAALLRAETLVIHMMRAADLPIARLGATSNIDRFGPDVAWDRLPTGEPRYRGVAAWFRAKPVSTMQLKGATLIAAELLEGAAPRAEGSAAESAFVYLDRRWHRLNPDDAN